LPVSTLNPITIVMERQAMGVVRINQYAEMDELIYGVLDL